MWLIDLNVFLPTSMSVRLYMLMHPTLFGFPHSIIYAPISLLISSLFNIVDLFHWFCSLLLYQLICLSDLEYDYINPYDSSSRINAVVLIEYLLQAALCASFLLTLHWFPFLVMAPVTYYHVKLYVLLSFSLYVNFSIVLSSLDTICSTWLDSPLDCFFIHGNNTLKLSRNLHVTAK